MSMKTPLHASMSIKPRLNTVRIGVDGPALEAQGYKLWRFVHPKESKRKTFSSIPAVNESFASGVLKSCVSGRDGSSSFAYILTMGDEIPFQERGPKRLPFSKVDPGIVLGLALLSGDVDYHGPRDVVRGLFGMRPVWETVAGHLKVVLDWVIVSEAVIHGANVYSLYPECKSLRTHKYPWARDADRKNGRPPLVLDDQKFVFMYRAERSETEEVAASGTVYKEVQGAKLGYFCAGDLVDGASVRHSKEASICWASSLPSKDARSRSTALQAVIEALPRSAFRSGITVELAHANQNDARRTKSVDAIIRQSWGGLRRDVFCGMRLAVLDLRLDRHHEIDLFMGSVDRFVTWLGLDVPDLRRLNLDAISADGIVAAVDKQVRAWHQTDASDVAWLCLVDNPDFLRGRPDTKRIAYRIARGRPLQSLCKGSAFLENPVASRLKREATQKKKRDERIASGKPIKLPTARRPVNPDDGPLDIGPTLKTAFANLALDVEILSGAFKRPRTWLAAATHYLFVDTVEVDGDEQCVWLSVSPKGELSFGGPGSASDALSAVGPGRRAMVCSEGLAEMFPDALHLRPTNMRAMPPATGTKKNWLYMSGVCVYPDLAGYTGASLDNPNGGTYEKGITVRVLDRSQPGDLDAVTAMCLDPLVRLGQATVVPAPFQTLREWAEANFIAPGS